MKSYHSLSTKYLKSFFSRTAMICFGIILATALITSIGIISESIHHTNILSVEKNFGSYHYAFLNISGQEAGIIEGSMLPEETGVIKNVGTFALKGYNNELDLAVWDAGSMKLNNIEIIEGRVAQGPGEIILPMNILKEMEIPFKEGLQITLTSIDGEREIILSLCGVYRTARWSITTGLDRGYPAMVSEDVISQLLIDKEPDHTIYFRIKSALDISNAKDSLLNAISNEITKDSVRVFQNYMLLGILGEIDTNNTASSSEKTPGYILMILIIAATATTIYNIFQLSSLQRMRQFGILRCVGASKRQIAAMVFKEAVIISLISIPLGLIAGMIFPGLILKVSSELFDITGGIIYPAKTLIISSGIAFITVFGAAFIPAITASKSSPIKALRMDSDVINESRFKNRKWHRSLINIAGPSTKIAYMNLWRHKSKTLMTCFSLMLGVTMFIVFGYYLNFYNKEEETKLTPGDYSLTTDRIVYSGSQEDYPLGKHIPLELEKWDEIDKISLYQIAQPQLIYPEDKISDTLNERYPGSYTSPGRGQSTDLVVKQGHKPMPVQVLTIPQEYIKQLNDFLFTFTAQKTALGDKNIIFFAFDDTLWEIGDTITLADFYFIDLEDIDIENAAKEHESVSTIKFIYESFVISGITDILPVLTGPLYTDTILMAEDDFYSFFGFNGYRRIDIFVKDDYIREAVGEPLKMMASNLNHVTFVSHQEQLENIRQMRLQISILVYGLIVILCVIAALSIVNTLATAVVMHKREYAMLRAVGLSKAQLKNIVLKQGLFYCISGAVFGSIAGVLINHILSGALGIANDAIIPWQHIGIVFIASVLLGIFASFRPARKIANSNIIETIRAID